jgi:hypothetical protein
MNQHVDVQSVALLVSTAAAAAAAASHTGQSCIFCKQMTDPPLMNILVLYVGYNADH